MNREMSPDLEETRRKYGDKLDPLISKREESKRKGDDEAVQNLKAGINEVLDEWKTYDKEVLFVDPEARTTNLEKNLQKEADHLTNTTLAKRLDKKKQN